MESLAEQAAAVEPAAPAPPAPPPPVASSCLRQVERDGDQVTLTRGSLSFQARVYPALLGRLRVTVRACRGNAFHLDTLDLLLSKSRTDFARKTAKA